MKVALVPNQLRDGDVLDRDGVVGVGRDHRVPMPIVMGGCQERLEIGKYRMIDFDHVRVGMEIRNGFVAEIGREYERVAIGPDRCGATAVWVVAPACVLVLVVSPVGC